MSRSARSVAFVAILILAGPAGAVDSESALRDVRALVFLAQRHDRLWSFVDGRIGAAEAAVDTPDGRRALTEIHYRFLLDWAASRGRAEDEQRVTDLIGIYGRALGLGLPVEQTEEARFGLVDLRLGEAERIRDQGGDLAPASEHVRAVLAMDGLSKILRDRAMNLGFLIDSHDAEQLLAAGDLTRGYDRLEDVVNRYGSMDLAALVTARERLATLERTTGVLTLGLFDVSGALRGARPEIVGDVVMLPDRVRIHRRLGDYRLQEAPVADAPLSRDEPTRIRLSLTDGAHFAARLAFLGGPRPDLRLPLDLSRKSLTVLLPDRVPLRMAFVPAMGGHGAYFIGLYEVTTEELNVYLESTRQRPRNILRPGLPVDEVSLEDVTGFLRFAGVSLPGLREWRDAAVGTDGRPLPWGAGDVVARANLFGAKAGAPVDVTSHGDDVGPYGLHHVLGNVWELIEGQFAMGGSINTEHPLRLNYRRANGQSATWEPDLLRDPRPLAPAGERLEAGDEMRRKWKEVLFDDPDLARVNQPGIGFRVAIRLESR